MQTRRSDLVTAVEELQRDQAKVRNICILAHVDHGKTSLSDSLLTSNHIISEKQAGQLRYLDSREDEQERMITMKASSISLVYNHNKPATKDAPAAEEKYLVNLMDSPGHVDFSSEVSSALRLADGALVLVDAVEGLSTQTYTVIKQAFEAKVKMCLVLNKIDRLIVELDASPEEIFFQLAHIIEQVNAIVAEII